MARWGFSLSCDKEGSIDVVPYYTQSVTLEFEEFLVHVVNIIKELIKTKQVEPERFQILKEWVEMQSQCVQAELHKFELVEVQIGE